MSKFQEIKDAQLQARKDKDVIKAVLLTTLIGETAIIGKNENRDVTDEDVLKTLKKFEKGMNDTIKFLQVSRSQDRIPHVQAELKIIAEFLPPKLTDENVLDDIKFIIGSKGLDYNMKNMGIITKELRAKYGDQFDGQQASTIFKSLT